MGEAHRYTQHVHGYMKGLMSSLALDRNVPLEGQTDKIRPVLGAIWDLSKFITSSNISSLQVPSVRLAELKLLPQEANDIVLTMVFDPITGHLNIMKRYKENVDERGCDIFQREVYDIAFIKGDFAVRMLKGEEAKELKPHELTATALNTVLALIIEGFFLTPEGKKSLLERFRDEKQEEFHSAVEQGRYLSALWPNYASALSDIPLSFYYACHSLIDPGSPEDHDISKFVNGLERICVSVPLIAAGALGFVRILTVPVETIVVLRDSKKKR